MQADMRTSALTLVLATAVGLGACERPNQTASAAGPVAVQPKQRGQLLPPTALPSDVRLLLKKRMHRHVSDANELLYAVLLVDYVGVEQYARSIASEAKIGKPRVGDDDHILNVHLPDTFFGLQDELTVRAIALATAAESRNPVAMSDAFGALTGTCVRCHATYIGAEPPAE